MINIVEKSLFYDGARLKERLFQMQPKISAVLRAIRTSQGIPYPYMDQVYGGLCKLTEKKMCTNKSEGSGPTVDYSL